MSQKEDFITALDTDLPDGVQNFVSTAIPTLAAATDQDTAQDVLAMNINAILKAFEGFTPVAALLHLGQRNKTLQNLLLSALVYVGSASESGLTVDSPAEGQTYDYAPIVFSAHQTGGDFTSVTATVDGSETVALTETTGDIWEADYIATPGDHVVVFTTDDDTMEAITVNFAYIEYELVTEPESGDGLPSVVFPLSVSIPSSVAEVVKEVLVTLKDVATAVVIHTYTLVQSATSSDGDTVQYTAAADLSDFSGGGGGQSGGGGASGTWEIEGDYTVNYNDSSVETKTKSIQFYID